MTRATILSSLASVEVNAWREMYSSLSKADNAARSPAMTSSTLLQPQLHSSSRRPSHSSHFLPCILLYYHRQRLILLSPYLPVAPLSLVPVATSSTKSTWPLPIVSRCSALPLDREPATAVSLCFPTAVAPLPIARPYVAPFHPTDYVALAPAGSLLSTPRSDLLGCLGPLLHTFIGRMSHAVAATRRKPST
ncbi:hypothetical protein BHE74_00025582 [Ensete ventricosum]|nr:hypothetical protein BHE74_00025582 [Ensete ventricosum]